MNKKVKKIFTIVTLISIAVPILLLIGAIFGLEIFDEGSVFLKILLTFASIAVAGGFAINALNIYKRNKKLSIASLCLLGISLILGIIIYWSNFATPAIFNNITIVIAMATIFFCIIVSMYIKLNKNYKTLQIITYMCICLIDIFLTINIFIINLFTGILSSLFIVLCLITFALLCTTGILGKKSQEQDEENESSKYIKITIKEYEELKNRITELENQLKKNG